MNYKEAKEGLEEYFQRNAMYCLESISAPSELHTTGILRFRDDVKLYRTFPVRNVGSWHMDFFTEQTSVWNGNLPSTRIF